MQDLSNDAVSSLNISFTTARDDVSVKPGFPF